MLCKLRTDMAMSSLRSGCGVHTSDFHLNEAKIISKNRRAVSRFCVVSVSTHNDQSKSNLFPVLTLDLKEKNPNFFPDQIGSRDNSSRTQSSFALQTKTSSAGMSRAMRWWEKTTSPNMLEICSSQQLVDSLLSAGDRLVVVDFYSPGCGGCRTLHPKICQLAESNPNVLFLKVNQEELREMCHSLNVHVLPFFRFYRGSDGKLCSFSCTNATIKKFKDALVKHGTERCSLGPAKVLSEKELTALASAGELPMNLPSITTKKMIMEVLPQTFLLPLRQQGSTWRSERRVLRFRVSNLWIDFPNQRLILRLGMNTILQVSPNCIYNQLISISISRLKG